MVLNESHCKHKVESRLMLFHVECDIIVKSQSHYVKKDR